MRKEYEGLLAKEVGGVYERLVNDKTREGREKIISEIKTPEQIEEENKNISGIVDYDYYYAKHVKGLFLEQYKTYLYKYDKEDWDSEEIIWDYNLGMPTKDDLLKFFEDDNIKSVELYGELYYDFPAEIIMEITR